METDLGGDRCEMHIRLCEQLFSKDDSPAFWGGGGGGAGSSSEDTDNSCGDLTVAMARSSSQNSIGERCV